MGILYRRANDKNSLFPVFQNESRDVARKMFH